jgi:hypothetical protein
MDHREVRYSHHLLCQNVANVCLHSEVAFLPPSGKGFSLDYPSLSLHAISRSLPSALQSVSNDSDGCLYCQLEGVEDEDEEIFPELWILPAEQDSCK